MLHGHPSEPHAAEGGGSVQGALARQPETRDDETQTGLEGLGPIPEAERNESFIAPRHMLNQTFVIRARVGEGESWAEETETSTSSDFDIFNTAFFQKVPRHLPMHADPEPQGRSRGFCFFHTLCPIKWF